LPPPVRVPVVELPDGIPVDDVPGDPVMDEAPMEPAEELPAARPPAPAAKAQLPDTVSAAAKISVVIFMDIILRCGRRIRRAAAGRSCRSGKRAPGRIINGNEPASEVTIAVVLW
jgi:hypothetical protein